MNRQASIKKTATRALPTEWQAIETAPRRDNVQPTHLERYQASYLECDRLIIAKNSEPAGIVRR